MALYVPGRGQTVPLAPGQARPQPPQSQGTPYGSWAPQQGPAQHGVPASPAPRFNGPRPAIPQNMTSGTQREVGRFQQAAAGPFRDNSFNGVTNRPVGGYPVARQMNPPPAANVANSPFANRPPPFQAATQNFDGTQSQMPNFQQRDAFISQINSQLGQMQGLSQARPGMGAPQFNFPQMWGQANQMVRQGWQNPFAGPQSPMGDMSPEGMRMLQSGWRPQLPPGAVS